MKKMMVVLIVFVTAGCTPMPVKETPPIETVIEMPNSSKDQIYAGAKSWIAENFRSAKAVIQDDDKEAGRVIGNGRTKYPCSGFSCFGRADWTLGFTMRVDIKEQKMKITFTNLGLSFPSTHGVPAMNDGHISDSDIDAVRAELLKMQDELKVHIEKNRASTNW